MATMMLMTADPDITRDVALLFRFFSKTYLQLNFKRLLVSPWNTRDTLEELIRFEMDEARAGRPARIDIKNNNLADYPLIDLLYAAAEAGVSIRLNVRGMFSLRPGHDEGSGSIQAMGVIDRYLELKAKTML